MPGLPLLVSGYQPPKLRDPTPEGVPTGMALSRAFQQALVESPVAAVGRISALRVTAQERPTGFLNVDRGMAGYGTFSDHPEFDPSIDPRFVRREQVEQLLADYGLPTTVFAAEMIGAGSTFGGRYFNWETAVTLAEAKRAELNRLNAISSARGFQNVGVFAAQLMGTMTDPVNVATSFFPAGQALRTAKWASRSLASGAGVSATARAARTAWRAANLERQLIGRSVRDRVIARFGEGALDGAVGAAMLEPVILTAAEMEASEYTIADSMMAVTFGTIMGAGLHAGSGAISDAFAKMRARGIEGGVVEAAEMAEPTGDMANAIRQLPPELRLATMRHVVASGVVGRRIDPEAIIAATGRTLAPERAPRMPAVVDAEGVRVGDEVFDSVEEFADYVERLDIAQDFARLEAMGLTDDLLANFRRLATPEERVDLVVRFMANQQKRMRARVEKRQSLVEWINETGGVDAAARQGLDSPHTGVLRKGERSLKQVRRQAQEAGFGSIGNKELARILDRHHQGLETYRRSDARDIVREAEAFDERFRALRELQERGARRLDTLEDKAAWAESYSRPENSPAYDAVVVREIDEAAAEEASAGRANAERAEKDVVAMEALTRELLPEGDDVMREALGAVDAEFTSRNEMVRRAVDCVLGVARG